MYSKLMKPAFAKKNSTRSQAAFDQDYRSLESLIGKVLMDGSYGILIADCRQEGRPVVYVNQAFIEMTGHKTAEVLGKSFPFLPGEDGNKKDLKTIRHAIRTGSRFTSMLPIRRNDGSTVYGEFSILPSHDEIGSVTHYVTMLRDVTAQVATEERLKKIISEKESRFAAYMENARECIWRCDLNPPLSLDAPELQQVHEVFHNAVYGEANDAMARQFGFVRGLELIGRPVAELLPQSDPKNVEVITQLVRQRFLWKNWITHEKAVDGSTSVYLNNIVPFIKDGKLLHTWGSSLDITDLFDAQEKLSRSERKLTKQKLVLERKNIALKELIAQIELEKKDLKDRIRANVENIILPSLDKIRFDNGAKDSVEQHRMTILDLTSSFGLKVADNRMKLTPREIEVCTLVKNGLTNKEISQLLCIALHTVEKHRRMARNKLGLANKGINLRTYLNSL